MFSYDTSTSSIAELVSLKGKTSFITGAAKGIGLAVARRFAEAGAQVALTDIDIDNAKSARAAIEKDFGVKAVALQLDISNRDAIRAALGHVAETLGHIDILVNNAGIFPFLDVLEIDDHRLEQLMNINLRGSFTCAREVSQAMVDSGKGGVIINMSSISAHRASGNSAHYVMSKFGLNGMTQGFARDLAARGVRVLAVAPTLVTTPGVQAAAEASAELAEGIEGFRKAIPMGRAAYPDDIARVVLFAASDMASFMTGSCLYVDGGHLTTG